MSDSREAFEKWAKGDLDLQHIGVCYGDETTDAAFRAWQAAQGQSSKPCPYIATSSEGTSWCRLAAQPQVNQQLLEVLKDARSALRYIREAHGELYGVGFDRVEASSTAAIAAAQQIPDLEAELREVLEGMGYRLDKLSPFVETESQGVDAAFKDALIYGTSVMRGGKHIPIQDFYVAPEQTVEPPQDMSDWRNWREGDLLLCVKGGVDLKEGNFYYISTRRHKLCVIDDDDCDRVLGLIDHNFLFHSRPAQENNK